MIGKLNPIIRGWANYFACVNASAAFREMDHLTYQKLWSWAKRRHVNKSRRWIAHKYWKVDSGKWNFSVSSTNRLYLHSQVKIKIYAKVKGTKPFMMEIGPTGLPGWGVTRKWALPLANSSKSSRENAIGVTCTLAVKTNWKLTTSVPAQKAEKIIRIICNYCTGIVITRKPPLTFVNRV